ncbi:fluoride efflux transporter CrcB [Niveibacterium sp. SC-1]|uniref:fluoride efflux transporter CrcB n=1 Tax=Niveibacterium sp. SC-1 TaxID=3135646 RepID=UPI00311DAD39
MGWGLDAVAVGAGAAVGALLRWGLGLWLNPVFLSLPLGTLAANLVGGFLMGVALAGFSLLTELPIALRLLLTTGFLGGLTTFSSFSGEVFGLIQREAIGWALAAIGLHVLGSLFMTWAGWATVFALRH